MTQGQPSRMHEVAIDFLCERYPHIQRRGFATALLAEMEIEGAVDEFDRSAFPRPDAYAIDRENKAVHLYEVVASHDINDDKMWRILELWFDLDSEGWSLDLTIVNRHGIQIGFVPDEEMVTLWQLHSRRRED